MSGEIYVQDFAALETLFKRFYKPLYGAQNEAYKTIY